MGGRTAGDFRRYLEGRPVLARPGSFGYRTSRFVRRNKALVGTMAAVALALTLGLGMSLWQALSRQCDILNHSRANGESGMRGTPC